MSNSIQIRTDNYFSITIDAEDKERIKQYNWKWREGHCCEASVNRKTTQLTRFILNYDGNHRVTFKNGDNRDFRKENLQVIERCQYFDDHMVLLNTKTNESVTVLYSVEDKEWIKQFSWSKGNKNYIYRSTYTTKIFIHREILQRLDPNNPDLFKDKEVDHINRNKFDNRRENLRIVSRVENNQNKGLVSYNSTGIRFVSRKDNKCQVGYYVEYSLPRNEISEPLKKVRKSFSDKDYGGKEEAFKAAKAFKESLDMEYYGSIQI